MKAMVQALLAFRIVPVFLNRHLFILAGENLIVAEIFDTINENVGTLDQIPHRLSNCSGYINEKMATVIKIMQKSKLVICFHFCVQRHDYGIDEE